MELLVIHCEPTQILVLGLRVEYKDLSTCHGWPVNKVIVNLLSRLTHFAFSAIHGVFWGPRTKIWVLLCRRYFLNQGSILFAIQATNVPYTRIQKMDSKTWDFVILGAGDF